MPRRSSASAAPSGTLPANSSRGSATVRPARTRPSRGDARALAGGRSREVPQGQRGARSRRAPGADRALRPIITGQHPKPGTRSRQAAHDHDQGNQAAPAAAPEIGVQAGRRGAIGGRRNSGAGHHRRWPALPEVRPQGDLRQQRAARVGGGPHLAGSEHVRAGGATWRASLAARTSASGVRRAPRRPPAPPCLVTGARLVGQAVESGSSPERSEAVGGAVPGAARAPGLAAARPATGTAPARSSSEPRSGQ
jgi:hypothetical protein